MPKVSVIVPIYNVEKYIERCIRSLFEQTLDDIEYIFVNDCTLDNSMIILEKVLEEYPHRIKQVKIINHEQNQGQAGARTSGMKAMTGEYMIHCDPDDWIELDMYEQMYNFAVSNNSDIVVCDLYHEYKQSSVKIDLYTTKTPKEIITSSEALDARWYLPCRLVRCKIITEYNIYPVKGINLLEDMIILFKIYYHCNKLCYLQKPLYHYNRVNENAITTKTSDIKYILQQKEAIKQVEDFLISKQLYNTLFFYHWKYFIKDKFLALKKNDYTNWRNTFPEISTAVKKDKQINFIYRNIYNLAHKNLIFLFLFMLYRKISKIINFIYAKTFSNSTCL
ncbi:MAG: glycosyltransferase family 2 protein [Muribaculaceae bacterium]|nr:glycosyltransferase family 2 protein [Muribaculaceae bacterium]